MPIINRSVVWWNSLHQGPSITVKGSSIASEILWPLAFTTLGFTLMFAAIVLMRMRTVLASAKVEARLRHWPYIIAAYALTIGGMAGLTLISWVRMRRAESQVSSLTKPFAASDVEMRPSTSLDTNGSGVANPS